MTVVWENAGLCVLYNTIQKRKNVIYRRCPIIKGAELGEGDRKLEGPTTFLQRDHNFRIYGHFYWKEMKNTLHSTRIPLPPADKEVDPKKDNLAGGGRIINLVCDFQYGKLNLVDLQSKHNYNNMVAYYNSKLALLYFTNRLASGLFDSYLICKKITNIYQE